MSVSDPLTAAGLAAIAVVALQKAIEMGAAHLLSRDQALFDTSLARVDAARAVLPAPILYQGGPHLGWLRKSLVDWKVIPPSRHPDHAPLTRLVQALKQLSPSPV